MGHANVNALEIAIGDGHVQAATVVQRLAHEIADDEDVLPPAVSRPRRQRPAENGIRVRGLDSNVLVRLAKCCTPVPGDPVIGFVTRGRGVSAHRADCPNVDALKEDAGRMIEVDWAPSAAGAYRVAIVIEALDRTKLLRDVTTTIGDLGVNITEAQTHSDRRRHVATLRFTLELPDTSHLDNVLRAVRRIDGVFEADRHVPGASST